MTEASLGRASRTSFRSTALAALWIGAAGTLALMLHAGGPDRPIILVPLFAAWDLSPFALLLVADRFVEGWPAASRTALYSVTIAVTVGSLTYYIADAIWPRTAQPAFPYVAAPPVCWIVIAVVLVVSLIRSRSMGRSVDA